MEVEGFALDISKRGRYIPGQFWSISLLKGG